MRRREAPGGAARRRAGRNRMAAAQVDDSGRPSKHEIATILLKE